MTSYNVEANTGSSIWTVTSYETSPEVDNYLRSRTEFTPQVAPGNAGMFAAPRFADVLVALLDAQDVPSGEEWVHGEAVRQVAGLVHLAATHHGAALNWEAGAA